jgi:L-ascorbate metabolism protein UlaG (beta-lactamase superfamily)
MKLKWLGTAGFQVQTGDRTFLIDPYLSRNPRARPVQPLKPADIAGAGQIFVTHGHFDHIADIPAIASLGPAEIYCSAIAADTLAGFGVDRARLHPVTEDGFSLDFGAYQAQAFFSRHVKFDIPLVARTLARIGASGYRRFSGLSKDYPEGQVLSWRFTANGFTMHHFGSGGSTPDEHQKLAARPSDLLLVPLQGHSNICGIAFEYVRVLKPRMVIPHHQDDFYPPISSEVDITPFIKAVKEKCPGTQLQVMEFNETVTL